MKSIGLFSQLVCLFYAISCADKSPGDNEKIISGGSLTEAKIVISDTLEAGRVITRVICKEDTAHSYAVYLPGKKDQALLPIIYFFDPHGDGALPLYKYQALADKYQFILVGSNNSRNGNDGSTTETIWNILSADVQSRLPVDTNRLYACGFSGGAKAAGQVALTHRAIKAVIANGAGLPDGVSPGNFPFSFTAIAGEGDMNMTDLVAFNTGLGKTQTKHRIIFFPGKHEWAPESSMNIAFAGLQFDAMREKLIPRDDTMLTSFIAGSKKRIIGYYADSNFIQAEDECRLALNLLEGLTAGSTWFNEKDMVLEKSPAYQKQWKAFQNLLTTEQNTKILYRRQFQQGDMTYWIKTISNLQMSTNKQHGEGAMNQRLLAYLSLAFYSISNQLINANRNKDAQYFVELYKIADAGNSEAWYFSALLNARNNNGPGAIGDLLKAVANGFSDKYRMMQQPEFQNPALQIDFAAIIKSMKK